MDKWEKTTEYKELRSDMLDDLQARGLVGNQYTDEDDSLSAPSCHRKISYERRNEYAACLPGAARPSGSYSAVLLRGGYPCG